MVTKKHKEYNLEDLHEGSGRMVDPHVNPNKADYSDEMEHGIDDDHVNGNKRWTIDAYDHDNSTGNLKGTEPMKEELKKMIKECIREVLTEQVKTGIVRNGANDADKVLSVIYPGVAYESQRTSGGTTIYYVGQPTFKNILASTDYDEPSRLEVNLHTPEAEANWNKLK